MTSESAELKRLIDKARTHVMTPLEIYEQRVSWIYGQLGPDSDVTREEVEQSMRMMGYERPDENRRAAAPAQTDHKGRPITYWGGLENADKQRGEFTQAEGSHSPERGTSGVAASAPNSHVRRVVGHASGWQEQMDTCVCGEKWPCPAASAPALPEDDTKSILDALWERATMKDKLLLSAHGKLEAATSRIAELESYAVGYRKMLQALNVVVDGNKENIDLLQKLVEKERHRAEAAERRAAALEKALNNLRQYQACEGQDERGKFIGLAYQGSEFGPMLHEEYDPWEFAESVEQWLHGKIDAALARKAGGE